VNEPEQPTGVVIVDDHPVFRSGLRKLLEIVDGLRVIGEARNGAEAIALCRQLHPDIVLMDIDMPGIDGNEATRIILAEDPKIVVLMLTMLYDDTTIMSAVRAGARGYLLKGAGLEDVTRAVDVVRAGGTVYGPDVAERVYEQLWSRPSPPPPPFPDLTDRERDVLEMVADGHNNAEIARALGLSIKTVRNYLSRIFVKLRVAHRSEAVVVARREGLGH
jgi:DNA-binding NarL/FixJ family response regulator